MRSIGIALALAACADAPVTSTDDASTSDATTADTGPTTTTEPADPDALSTLGVVTGWDGEALSYGDGVHPYVLATPLFSDYSVKARAVALPEGTSASYTDIGVVDFPVGTVIVKSFLFPADLRAPDQDLDIIETRVLTLKKDGWAVWPYLWNDEQTEAFRAPSGAVKQISVTGLDGEPMTFPYLVPQRNQCVDCHERSDDSGRTNQPIGPSIRNLNVGNQLQRLIDDGVVTGVPALDTLAPATDATAIEGVDPATMTDEVLTAAARDYLDVNCAHCHNPDGTEGRSSQLFLNWDNEDMFNVGVCKKPGSAGRGTGGRIYDIVPGQPEESILWYRTQTGEVGEMMPDIGRSLVHEPGVDLVAEWIRRLEGSCEDKAE